MEDKIRSNDGNRVPSQSELLTSLKQEEQSLQRTKLFLWGTFALIFLIIAFVVATSSHFSLQNIGSEAIEITANDLFTDDEFNELIRGLTAEYKNELHKVLPSVWSEISIDMEKRYKKLVRENLRESRSFFEDEVSSNLKTDEFRAALKKFVESLPDELTPEQQEKLRSTLKKIIVDLAVKSSNARLEKEQGSLRSFKTLPRTLSPEPSVDDPIENAYAKFKVAGHEFVNAALNQDSSVEK